MSLKVNANDHVLGNTNAPIELIEYADYQCPYCQQAYYILKDIQNELGNDLKFVFRNFPLPNLHPHAIHAAVAAETASAQNRFWEMHDTLFENQKNLDDHHLLQYAEEIGLDINRFEKDFGKDPYFQKVNHDYETGVQNNVQGTPTFFINGDIYEGNWMDSSFITYLKSFIR